MGLFHLLLLSLPFLQLCGFAKAKEADAKAPPNFCYDLENEEKIWCKPEKPFCKLSVEVNPKKVYTNKTGTTSKLRVGCIAAEKEGCQQNPDEPASYLCFCDSRIAARCNERPEIINRLKEIAAEMYRVAHSTTPPTTTTTTPDPNHYCLGGTEKKPCNFTSFFCNSKIFLDPLSGAFANEIGIGSVEKLPEEGLEDRCRKVKSFNISDPVFECFCKSVMGHACNDLKEATNSARQAKWASDGGKMLLEAVKIDAIEKYKEFQITTPDPNRYCLNRSSVIVCSGTSFCHTKIFFDPAGRYQNNHTGLGCVDELPEKSLNYDCREVEPFSILNPAFDCFCHSEIGYSCNNLEQETNAKRRDDWYRASLKLLIEAEKAQTTTPPPTTTADPNHRCLEGAAPPVACNGSSFCHSKIFFDPATLQPSDRIGLGCVENLPDETLNNRCRKVEPFDISAPAFECFCPSKIGRACNALDEAMNSKRKAKWEGKGGQMLLEIMKDVAKEEAVEIYKKQQTAAPPSITTADENTTSGSKNALFLGCPVGMLLLLLFLAGPSFSLPFSPTP